MTKKVMAFSEICELLRIHFGGNSPQVYKWLGTPNSLLGGEPPINYVNHKRLKDLEKFVKEEISETKI